jgi:hypothetical protein
MATATEFFFTHAITGLVGTILILTIIGLFVSVYMAGKDAGQREGVGMAFELSNREYRKIKRDGK